jgi:hypothetical protein
MSPVDTIVAKLHRYPEVTYTLLPEQNGIRIEAQQRDGFSVALMDDGREWTVCAGDGGGHWHFDDPDAALDLLAFCLSEDCRLRVEERAFETRYTLEARTGDGWEMAWRCGFLALRFWRPRVSAIFQNRLIPTASTSSGRPR